MDNRTGQKIAYAWMAFVVLAFVSAFAAWFFLTPSAEEKRNAIARIESIVPRD